MLSGIKAGSCRQQKVQYIIDPSVQESYITTAAIAGQEMKLEGKPSSAKIGCYDLDDNLKKWLGVQRPQYQCRVRSRLFVLPDAHSNLVQRHKQCDLSRHRFACGSDSSGPARN